MSTPENETEIVLRHLSVVKIEPGDVLVFRSPNVLSLRQIEYLSEAVKREFPDVRCMVLSEGVELGIVRP